MRLWAMVPFIPFVPIGALLFGAALSKGWSWWVVAVGFAVCNFGVTPISGLALTYITDCYADVSFLNFFFISLDLWQSSRRKDMLTNNPIHIDSR